MEKTYQDFLKEFGNSFKPLKDFVGETNTRIIVHDGVFHADDVLAAAIVREYILTHSDYSYEDCMIQIARTRDLDNVEPLDNTLNFILDVGKQDFVDPTTMTVAFDHHQDDAYFYDNGVQMAACGKIFSCLYNHLEEPIKKFILDRLLYPIESKDNGQKIEGLREHKLNFVHEMNLSPNEDYSIDKSNMQFEISVNYAQNIFRRMLIHAESYSDSLHEFAQGVVNMRNNKKYKDVLLFNKGIPWTDFYFSPGNIDRAKFVMFPHIQGGWVIRTIPVSAESYEQTYPLPQTWWGKEGIVLSKVSGVRGAVFCHNNGFMAKWDTKEHALMAVREALDYLKSIDYKPPVVNIRPEYVAVDFDGTLTMPGSKYVGDPNFRDFNFNMKAIDILKEFKSSGGKLLLWTCRANNGDATLNTVVEELSKLGLEFDAVNENHKFFLELFNGLSNKIVADFYIDDRSVIGGKLDWNAIDRYLNPKNNLI